MNTLKHNDICKFKEESALSKYGYSVSEKANLSDIQRQLLLKKLIDSKKMTVKQIQIHLNRLIILNQNKYCFIEAVRKWKKDLCYIANQYDDGSAQINLNFNK